AREHAPRGETEEDDEEPVAGRPELRLRGERQARLDQERVREQGEEAPHVAGRVEEVRVRGGRVTGGREPALEHRARRRDDEEREPRGDGEESEQPEGRAPSRR